MPLLSEGEVLDEIVRKKKWMEGFLKKSQRGGGKIKRGIRDATRKKTKEEGTFLKDKVEREEQHGGTET